MNSKYFKYIFFATIAILIIAGIYIIYLKDIEGKSSVQAKNKETIITKDISIGITEFDTINPILTKSLEMQNITRLIYEPLINITQDFNIKPELAEECSKLDELTYIINLNNEKKWTNGEKVKVEDIEFTIKIINENDSIYNENIKEIESIEKINEETLKIHLKKPVEFFEYLLCFPIVQESTYNENLPMGTGEYKIKTINEKEIEIIGEERNIIIKIYKTIAELYNNFTRENVDYILTKNTNYEEYIGNIGFEETIIIGREFYYISCENIENIEERKLIASNINKEKIVYDLYNQKYKIVDFPLQYGSYLNKENNNMEEQKNTKELKYTISVGNDEEKKLISKIIEEQLKEKGIELSIQYYTNTNAKLILKKQAVPITPDISIYFEDKEKKSEIQKISTIENEEILKQEYDKIIKKYYEEIPFISLYFNTYIILHNSNLKGDFSGNWYNIFYNIDTWYKTI